MKLTCYYCCKHNFFCVKKKQIEEIVDEVVEVDEEEGSADEADIDVKDIELVMSQVSCTRAKAVTALKNNSNDVVEAIMALSS